MYCPVLFCLVLSCLILCARAFLLCVHAPRTPSQPSSSNGGALCGRSMDLPHLRLAAGRVLGRPAATYLSSARVGDACLPRSPARVAGGHGRQSSPTRALELEVAEVRAWPYARAAPPCGGPWCPPSRGPPSPPWVGAAWALTPEARRARHARHARQSGGGPWCMYSMSI